jgi:hypothetical protein
MALPLVQPINLGKYSHTLAARVAPVTARASATLTIQSGAAVSNVLDMNGWSLLAIITPAAWTTAVLSFQSAVASDGTFYPVDDDQTEYALSAVSASRWVRFQLPDSLSFPFFRLGSGTFAIPVNQAADRALTLILG